MQNCEAEISNARIFINKKMDALGFRKKLKRLNSQYWDDSSFDDSYTEVDKTNIEDLIFLTTYLDKLYDGPNNCLPSKCEILPPDTNNQSSVLCTFDFKFETFEN